MSPASDSNLEACRWRALHAYLVEGVGAGLHSHPVQRRGSWCLLAYQAMKANAQIQALPNCLQALNWSQRISGFELARS